MQAGSAGDRLPPTPTEPTPHREGHGPRFLRVCVRLPPETASQAGEQDFDVQYGVRFTPSWATARVQVRQSTHVPRKIFVFLLKISRGSFRERATCKAVCFSFARDFDPANLGAGLAGGGRGRLHLDAVRDNSHAHKLRTFGKAKVALSLLAKT